MYDITSLTSIADPSTLLNSEYAQRTSRRQDVNAAFRALQMFRKASRSAFWHRVFASLLGRTNRLYDLDDVERVCARRGSHYLGLQVVDIRDIWGTQGRPGDFDRDFCPLSWRLKDRWMSVAQARIMGLAIPPVELVKVDSLYFVIDGHHRISVARALGERMVDAVVTAVDLQGPLPWQVKSTGASAAGPGARTVSAVRDASPAAPRTG